MESQELDTHGAIVAVELPLMGVEPVVVVVIGGQVQGNDSEASQPNEWFPPKGRLNKPSEEACWHWKVELRWDLRSLPLESSAISKAEEPALQSWPKSLILRIPLFSTCSSQCAWSAVFYWKASISHLKSFQHFVLFWRFMWGGSPTFLFFSCSENMSLTCFPILIGLSP